MITRRFGYWRDPACLAASAAYACNRWIVPLTWQSTWWRGHVADLLLIPAGLPLWLWLERQLGWRGDDGMPRVGEVLFVLVTWTVAAEWAAPRLFARATADPLDAVAYGAGAVAVTWWWRARRPGPHGAA